MAYLKRYRHGKRSTERQLARGELHLAASGTRYAAHYSLSIRPDPEPLDAPQSFTVHLSAEEVLLFVSHVLVTRDMCEASAELVRKIERLTAKDPAQLRIG